MPRRACRALTAAAVCACGSTAEDNFALGRSDITARGTVSEYGTIHEVNTDLTMGACERLGWLSFRFVLRDVQGEPYVYLYFREQPDSTVVACARDAPWLLAVLGIDDFKALVGKTLEFNGGVENHPCTTSGASLWIYQRTQARIASGPSR